MPIETTIPRNDPPMLAWTAHTATDEYANSRKWAAYPESLEGSLWALFVAGWRAALAAAPTPPEQADAWDTSAAFDAWWDAGNLMKANPYNEGTPAFWAWEGWCAAMGEPK